MCCASCSSGTRFTPGKTKTTSSHKLSVNFMSLTLQTLKSELSARLSTTGGRLTSPHFSSLMHHAVASLSIHIALNLATRFLFKAFFAFPPPPPWWTISKCFFALTVLLSSQPGKLLCAGTKRQVLQTSVNLALASSPAPLRCGRSSSSGVSTAHGRLSLHTPKATTTEGWSSYRPPCIYRTRSLENRTRGWGWEVGWEIRRG